MAVLAEPDASTRIDAPIREAARQIAVGETEAALALLAPFLSDEAPCLPARFVLAMAAWRMQRLDWAIDVLRFCHERWPMDRDVAEALASLFAQSGDLVESLYMGKLGTALGGAGALAPLAPEDFPPFELAIVTIRERPLLEEAKTALAAGRLDVAVAKARQHVSLRADDAEGVAFCAAAELRAGRSADAVALLRGIESEAECAPALASLYARSLTAAGDFAEARRWHDHAVALAPRDPVTTAARAADALWLERDPKRASEAWMGRFCVRRKPRVSRPAGTKLVVVYLVSALADPRDAVAVGAVARASDRGRMRVIGYGTGAQSWPENAALGGAFDEWRDIAALDAPTIARALERDGADLVVDVSGLHGPQSLLALAMLESAVCVGWLGSGVVPDQTIHDATIAVAFSESAPGRWLVGGAYPLSPAASKPRPDRAVLQFGADVGLCQLDPETVAAWSGVLRAAPDARLVLRANDAGSGMIERLIARFGRDLAARIDLVATDLPEEFFALVDIALAPRRGVSVRLASQATASGVPCVAFGASDANPYSAFLHRLGLGRELVAADAGDYVALAARLAGSPEARARIGSMAQAAAGDGALSAAQFARMLEENTIQVLRDRASA